jgi:hypothetical protein
MTRVFEQNQRAVVQVVGPRSAGTGVIVGAQGHVVTSTEYVGVKTAVVRFERQDHLATVVATDEELGIALIKMDAPREFPATAVTKESLIPRGAWILGISVGKDGVAAPKPGWVMRPQKAGSPYVEVDVKLPPGSPLFDTKGRLIAVAAGKVPSRAVVVPAIRKQVIAGSSE